MYKKCTCYFKETNGRRNFLYIICHCSTPPQNVGRGTSHSGGCNLFRKET